MCILVFPHVFLTRTYAVSVLVEGQRSSPGVQVHSDDGTLAKTSGELHFVPFVLQLTWMHKKVTDCKTSITFSEQVYKRVQHVSGLFNEEWSIKVWHRLFAV